MTTSPDPAPSNTTPAVTPAPPDSKPAAQSVGNLPPRTDPAPIGQFQVLGERHDPQRATPVPLWLWSLALAMLILLGAKVYRVNSASAPPEDSLSRLEAKIAAGTDTSRARAMLAMARGSFPLEQRKLLLMLFDDAQPEELNDLAVVILATHYHLRGVPASLEDIQVVGAGSPTSLEYPGGRPSYLEANEKFDLKKAITARINEEDGQPQPPIPPTPAAPEPKLPLEPATPGAPAGAPPAAIPAAAVKMPKEQRPPQGPPAPAAPSAAPAPPPPTPAPLPTPAAPGAHLAPPPVEAENTPEPAEEPPPLAPEPEPLAPDEPQAPD